MQPLLCDDTLHGRGATGTKERSASRNICAVKSATVRTVVDIRRTRDRYMVFRQDGTWYITESLSPIFHQTLDLVTEQGTMFLLPIDKEQAESLDLKNNLSVELHSGGARIASPDGVVIEAKKVFSLNADSQLYRMR